MQLDRHRRPVHSSFSHDKDATAVVQWWGCPLPPPWTRENVMTSRLPLALGCLCLLLPVLPLQAADPSPEGVEFFEKKVRPVFVNHCQECHGDKKQRGSLRVTSRATLLKGGDTGPAIV